MSGRLGAAVAGLIVLIAIGFVVEEGPRNERSYFHPQRALIQKQSAIILFGGDLMFDRYIRVMMDRQGEDFPFSCIDNVLRDADLVVANLEGPVTGYASQSVGSEVGSPENFIFTFPTSTAKVLFRHNIRIVDLGNNHSMNLGRDGLDESKRWLTEAGVEHFGDAVEYRVARQSLHDVHLAFVSYNEFGGSDALSTEQIQIARNDGYIPIVYAHWGEEYATSAPERIKKLAREFVDAGAEIIVGSHPHVVQERELYRGKHIYYSLGNFIFDQYWNESVRRGLLVRAEFSSRGVVGVEEIPIDSEADLRMCAE